MYIIAMRNHREKEITACRNAPPIMSHAYSACAEAHPTLLTGDKYPFFFFDGGILAFHRYLHKQKRVNKNEHNKVEAPAIWGEKAPRFWR